MTPAPIVHAILTRGTDRGSFEQTIPRARGPVRASHNLARSFVT